MATKERTGRLKVTDLDVVRAALLEAADTLEDAHDLHIYSENDEHPSDCSYCEQITRWRKLAL